MKETPIIPNELDRLKALESYSIMDTLPEKEYDAITEMASLICGTPISLISLVDHDRQWFKSSVGLGIDQTSRDFSFCHYTIMGDDVYEVTNALENELFANNPLVTGNPNIRFYAGAPLKDSNGFNLGSLCVIGTERKKLSEDQIKSLKLLAIQVSVLLDLRKKNDQLLNAEKEITNFIELSKDLVCIASVNGMFYKVNPAFTAVLGYLKEELEGTAFTNFVHPDDLDKTNKEVEKLAAGAKTISFENRYRCKNGKYVILSWNSSPDPLTGKLYCIARDMTEEKRQQEELFNTSADLAAILNAAEFSIIAAGIDGVITHFNKGAEKLLGYKAEDVVGKTTCESLHVKYEVIKYTTELSIELGEEVEPTFIDFVIKSCESGRSSSREWTYNRKDGSSFTMLLSLTAVKNIDGDITGYLGIGKDVTKQKKAELNLIKSNKLLDDSESIAKTGSWKFDATTMGLTWSKGNYKITGIEELSEKELFKAYKAMLSAEDIVLLKKAIEKSLITGKNFEFQSALYLSKNRVKHIMLLGQFIKNELGEVIGAHGSTQDVTEKILADKKILASNQLLDDAENIAQTGSWKFNAVTKDLMLSKGQCRIFELEGVPADKLYNAYRNRIHYEDLAKLDELDALIVKSEEDYNTTYRLLFPDNRIKYISEKGQAYKNKNGDIVGIQGSVQCITEKILADQVISEKSKEVNDIRAALDESSIVSVTDIDGIFSYVNDNFCTISKYDKEELLGVNQQIISNHLPLEFVEEILNTIVNGGIWKGEIKNKAKDGSFYWEKTTIVPFLDDKGKIYQYIAISADISEQKLAQENLNYALIDLEKNNKELDQFAYIVSHDLKAPLRAIYSLSEWIVEDMPNMPKIVSDNFSLLRGRVQRMENLINGVLDYSRIGRTEIKRELVDVKEMLGQIAETLVPKKDFQIAIEDDIPQIIVAKILLYQIFSNLISNAVKYNDKPIGKIECHYESIPGFHQFSVKDNGPGIAERYHKKVFQVFQTIDARDKNESTGIGLSIVQKIVEEKGGSIKIESEENKGTNFIFTLPKRDSNEGEVQ
jgi:PAS domain S-box-containing protein